MDTAWRLKRMRGAAVVPNGTVRAGHDRITHCEALMDKKSPETKAPAASGRHEEAKHLAEEAMEEFNQGNQAEGKFVLDEARKLDPSAVEEVTKTQQKG